MEQSIIYGILPEDAVGEGITNVLLLRLCHVNGSDFFKLLIGFRDVENYAHKVKEVWKDSKEVSNN